MTSYARCLGIIAQDIMTRNTMALIKGAQMNSDLSISFLDLLKVKV